MEVKNKIKRAYLKPIQNDAHLLEIDLNERSLTNRLTVYLEEEYPEEYNPVDFVHVHRIEHEEHEGVRG